MSPTLDKTGRAIINIRLAIEFYNSIQKVDARIAAGDNSPDIKVYRRILKKHLKYYNDITDSMLK